MTERPRLAAPLGVVALTLTVLTSGTPTSRGQEVDARVGTRVMARSSETKLRVEARVTATLNAGSVFRVERAQGTWLWVDSGNIRGWAKEADVVAFDRAIDYFSGVIRDEPSNTFALISRGLARHAARDYEGAAADYTAAIALDPTDDWAYHNRAVARYARGEFDRALADADEAVRLRPSEPAHLANRASIEYARKDFDRALADYSEALTKLKGDEAYLDDSGDMGETGRTHGRLLAVKWTCARAECWVAKHATAKAVADYAEALRLDALDSATFNSLAWLLSTCGESQFRDGRRALELALRACELTGYRNHLCLDTLAAASAEAGDFTAAVRWLTRALDLTGGDARFAAGYRARLKLFAERSPYREEVP